MDNVANAERTATVDRTGAAREEGLRALALTTLRKKADFRVHLLVYVLVNGMIVGIWMITGSGSSGRSSRSLVGASAWPCTRGTSSW